MTANLPFPLFQKALGRHLGGVRGLKGINAFLREGEMWREASRLGQTLPERVDATLQAFDPAAGGAVEAIEGTDMGWSASYMLGGPGLDMVLLLRLEGLNSSELQSQLSVIESTLR